VYICSFPYSNPEQLQRWITWTQKINGKKWHPVKLSMLCSDHFAPGLLYRTPKLTRLRNGAVPTMVKRGVVSVDTDSDENDVEEDVDDDGLGADDAGCANGNADDDGPLTDHGYCKPSDHNAEPAVDDGDRNTNANTVAAPQCVVNSSRSSEMSAKSRRAAIKRAARDHHYYVVESPQFLKRKLAQSRLLFLSQRRRLKGLQQKNRRLKKKVVLLSDVIVNLKVKLKKSSNGTDAFLAMFNDITKDLILRMVTDKKKGYCIRREYSPQLRDFACTLNSYSPKAYRYVRDTLQLSLPHPNVLQSWSRGRHRKSNQQNSDAEPGCGPTVSQAAASSEANECAHPHLPSSLPTQSSAELSESELCDHISSRKPTNCRVIQFVNPVTQQRVEVTVDRKNTPV